MKLNKIITNLSYFASDAKIADILNDLLLLQENITEHYVVSARKKLRAVLALESSSRIIMHYFFSPFRLSKFDLIYEALLVLAELMPLNTDEPIYLTDIDMIKAENKIYISTGHVYDITVLALFFKSRLEKNQGVWFNISANEWFLPRDIAHIKTHLRLKALHKKEIDYPCTISMLFFLVIMLHEFGARTYDALSGNDFNLKQDDWLFMLRSLCLSSAVYLLIPQVKDQDARLFNRMA